MIVYTYKVLTAIGTWDDWVQPVVVTEIFFNDRLLYTFSNLTAADKRLMMPGRYEYREVLNE